MSKGARAGGCLLAAAAGAAVLTACLAVFGGSIGSMLFIWATDAADLDADERLPRGGPGDVLLKPVPRLAEMGLKGAPLEERPDHDGWERVYKWRPSADDRIVVRLDASRTLVREIVLPHPAPPVNWEAQAGPRAWGPPKGTTGEGDVHESRWSYPLLEARIRWHGPRPGKIDEVRWTRKPRP